jgi:hypothetical protein
MSINRPNPRRDSNEAAIVRHLQDSGALVLRVSGRDLPDLLVGFCGLWWPCEIKAPRGRLSPGQMVLIQRAADHHLPVGIVRDLVEADALLRNMAAKARHPL